MGFASIDDFLNKTTNLGVGTALQTHRYEWNKQNPAAYVAGRWYDFNQMIGNPTQTFYGDLVVNNGPYNSAWGWTGTGSGGWVYTQTAGAANGVFTHTAGTTGAISQAGMTLTNGLTYLVVWTIGGYSGSGNFTVALNGGTGVGHSASGTYYDSVVAGASGGLTITATGGTAGGTIANVHVFCPQQAVQLFDTNTTTGAMYHGGNVSPATKHVLNAGAVTTASAGVPSYLVLCDFLVAYPMITCASTSAQILSNVINGTFSGSAAGWTVGAAWTYNSNAVDKNSDGVTTLSQTTPVAPIAGRTYAITYTISNFTVAGTITVGFGGATAPARTLANGTYTELITAVGTGDLIFTPTSLSRFTIDNVNGTVALPRYTDGVGVRPFVVYSWGAQALAQNINISYTNTALTTGQTMSSIVTNQGAAASIPGHIEHSGTTANNYGPFLPLAAGDVGVRSVDSITYTAAGTASTYATLVLARPLLVLPLTTAFVMSERNYMNQLPSMPRVYDGAYLGWLYFAGGTTASATTFMGYLDIAWGA